MITCPTYPVVAIDLLPLARGSAALPAAVYGYAMGVLTPGDRVGAYEIRAHLAQGGMGHVYKAWDPSLGRFVAIKVMTGLGAADENFRRRFRKEALHLASVDHPNVIPVYAVGETADGDPYLAMKFVDGPDLETRVQAQGPLTPALAVEVITQTARALAAAHAADLVHRDVKPANVLLSEDGDHIHAYLADFGLTKSARDVTLTATGEWFGTAGYASPEQIQGEPVGPASDVYSLGCVLYFCLAGSPPFSGAPAQVMWAHVHEELPQLPSGVPHRKELDAVIRRATAKNPEDRYASPMEVAREVAVAVGAVASFPDMDAVHAAPTRHLRRSEPAQTAEPTAVMAKRRRWPYVAATAVVLLLAAVAGAMAVFDPFGQSDTESATQEPTGRSAAQSPPDSPETSSPPDVEPADPPEPSFVRTKLDPTSGASAVMPRGERSVESFGGARHRTRIDTPAGTVVIVDYTPQDPPNPGSGYSTSGAYVTNPQLGVTAEEYLGRTCDEGAVCINYSVDLGGYGFGVLVAADTQEQARRVARRLVRTLDVPAATLQPPDVVQDCVSAFAPNVADMSVRNMDCAEADDLIVAVIQDLQPGPFQSAGFSCQILQWGPKDGPILGADNVRCVQGDRAFRFSWGD